MRTTGLVSKIATFVVLLLLCSDLCASAAKTQRRNLKKSSREKSSENESSAENQSSKGRSIFVVFESSSKEGTEGSLETESSKSTSDEATSVVSSSEDSRTQQEKQSSVMTDSWENSSENSNPLMPQKSLRKRKKSKKSKKSPKAPAVVAVSSETDVEESRQRHHMTYLCLVDKDEVMSLGIKCNCPSIYAPVCGSDHTTYHNRCFLHCRSKEAEKKYHRYKTKIIVRHFGECKQRHKSHRFEGLDIL